jgi:hypothetical protein
MDTNLYTVSKRYKKLDRVVNMKNIIFIEKISSQHTDPTGDRVLVCVYILEMHIICITTAKAVQRYK